MSLSKALISSEADRRVAGVVVTYNGQPDIDACLQSLCTGHEDLCELVVIDNASNDQTPDFVRRRFPAVRVMVAEQNLGYGCAGNRGVLAAQAEFVAIMNQDIVSCPGWIARVVSALEEDPAAALATPKILVKSNPDRINTCGNESHYTGITTCRGYNRSVHEYARQEEVTAVSGAAFVIRRSAFERLGGFDHDFFLYLEDTDLSLRASLAGYRCLYVPDACVLHEFTPRFSADKIFFLERNRHLMLLKLFRWRTLLVLLPAFLLTELLVWQYSLLRGRRSLMAKFRASLWVLGHIRPLLQARRQAQALRAVADKDLLAHFSPDLHLEELEHPLGRLAARLINPFFRGWYRAARAIITW
jgi:GT2 family glycosyltransferase